MLAPDRVETGLLCLGVFLAPIRTFRPTEFAVTYSDIVFFLLGIMMIVRRRVQIAPLQDMTILWMSAIFLLISGLFVSSIVNGSAAASLIVCTQYFFCYAFMPFIIIQNDQERALLLTKIYLYSSLFIVLCGFVFLLFDYDGGKYYVTGSGRLASFSSNPNALASQIALTFPILLYLWFSRSLSTIISLAVFVCLVIGLILTSSNGGLASSVLGIGLFLLLAGKIRWILQGVVLGGLIVGTTLTIGYDYLPEVFQRRVLQGLESGDIQQAGTYRDRMELNIEASEWIGDTLFLGIGTDQYRELSYWGKPVHNQYLIVWVEGGSIAFFGWMLIITTMGIVGIRAYQQPSGALGAATILSILAIFAILANTTPHIYARFWIIPILIAIGLTQIPNRFFGVPNQREAFNYRNVR